MSYTAVNNMIAKMIYEAQVQAIDNLKALLSEKIAIESVESEFATLLSSLALTLTKNDDELKDKKKRQPSLFNLFVKHRMTSLKTKNPDKKGKELIGMASEEWKSDPFAAYLKETMDALKNENPESSNEILFEKAKEKYGSKAPEAAKTLEAQPAPEAPKPKADLKPTKPKRGGKKKPEEPEQVAELEFDSSSYLEA